MKFNWNLNTDLFSKQYIHSSEKATIDKDKENGYSYAVVLRLLKDNKYHGHAVYMDN